MTGEDIVQRLRQLGTPAPCPTLNEAADEIERLRADVSNFQATVDLQKMVIARLEAYVVRLRSEKPEA